MPEPGVDYPQTWSEFMDWFHDEDDCRAYIENLRWPDGFICPACEEQVEPYRTTRGRLTCRSCLYETTVTAGTIFHGTRTPLRTWFAAAWYITNQKHSTNATALQSTLGFGSYQTAWAMLHKFRRAMVRKDRPRLEGRVEVDETYIGGPEEGVRGRQTEKKAIVAIAVEMLEGHTLGRIRLRRVPDIEAESLVPFVCEMVEPGSTVHTDGLPSYNPLEDLGYRHEVTIISQSVEPAHKVMPGVHLVSSLLKRWILGTLHGSVSHAQMDHYLDEFTFRFNRKNSRSRGMLFYRLIEQSVVTGPNPYRSIIGGRREN